MVADLGRSRPDRHLCRDAVRSQRPQVPVQGQVPRDAVLRRGHAEPRNEDRKEISFYRTVHGPVVGYARVHGRLVALRASAPATARTSSTCSSTTTSPTTGAQRPPVLQGGQPDAADVQLVLRRRQGHRRVHQRPGPDPPLATWIRRCRSTAPARRSGRDSSPSRTTHRGSIRPAARSSTGTTGRRPDMRPRTTTGRSVPLQRVDLLTQNLGNGKNITPAQGRVGDERGRDPGRARDDVRAGAVEAVARRQGSQRAATRQMLSLLDAWRTKGGSRLDRTDKSGIGNITAPGAAIMDTAWPLLANAWASSVLGSKLSGELASFESQFNQPPGGQYTGWHIYMDKDLRTMLGENVRGKYSVRYCGGGNVKRCRSQLWAAIERPASSSRRSQGSNPSHWRASSANAERIRFVPGSAAVHDALHEPPDWDPAGAQLLRSLAAGHRTLIANAWPGLDRGVRGSARQRPAGERHDRADRRRRRTSVGTIPRRATSSAAARGRQQHELPPLLKRPGERDRRTEDRADRRGAGAVEERVARADRCAAARSAVLRRARTRTTARTRPRPPARRRRRHARHSRPRRRSRRPGPGVTWPRATAFRN